jgi:uncharacterized membrane protein YecN with MAPEG domain
VSPTVATDPAFGVLLFGWVWALVAYVVVAALYVGILVVIALGLRWLIRRNDTKRRIAHGASAAPPSERKRSST